METEIRELVIKEILDPTWETTRQLLKVLSVKLENGIPKIAHIEIKCEKNQSIVYLEIENESFFLEVVVDTKGEFEIYSVDTAPFVAISFMPTSEDWSVTELLKLTSIEPSKKIFKGDFFETGKFKYSYNALVFESFPKPGGFAEKIENLLAILESDLQGVKRLSNLTNCKDLFVTIVYHIGNGNFTGLYLDSRTVQRLARIGLELTFDIYASGNKFEDN